MRLDGKVTIITGAASGIGRATAELFAREGALVVAGDVHAARLSDLAAVLEAVGRPVHTVVGDIGERPDAEALVRAALDRHGRVDVLVNNAGIMDYMAGVGELTDDVWRRVMRVNVDGPMYTSRLAVPAMLTQGRGVIINVASIASLSGGAAGAAYTTSKHALLGLTRSTAWMYAQRGIRCNVICPGATKTNIAESMPADRLDPVGAARAGQFATLIPAWLESSDIAELALFLASDAARFINGAVVTADGGWMAA
ncbi:MAG: SDR family oxidoreductase [Gemmatimonas sp.]|jgi:NAD(P)-dependent dehydrogenase (short-subunit alcohol dehydrogenase family)|uniref:SDR family oxidoreductase n=1 Tax=Gemmatimonas sp. TaxID=1962908 RepID=UPI0022C1B302|nr:SDR family oxidoreductase [Gemmatimonas sp.]MCZ8013356.1 SDR family oxidoreductase [Gemmatimonas sp.]MCZ8268596.1 SDR family oxidoreductase [Gemmatimonas sp.]